MRKWFNVVPLALLISILIFWISKREPRPWIDPPSVLAQVQRLNQLATVKYTIQKVIGLTEQKRPVGSESILLIVQASVQAGINLASLRPEDITVRPDGAVVLRLPPAKILNVSIDEKETKVWDRQKTWGLLGSPTVLTSSSGQGSLEWKLSAKRHSTWAYCPRQKKTPRPPFAVCWDLPA